MALQPEKEIARFIKNYAENIVGWQEPEAHPALVKYIHLISPPTHNQRDRKIFVPLCGKTLDIPYLLNLGFHVFGIEGVRQAVEELGIENGLELQYDKDESIYYTADKKLIVYCGDFFKCPIEKWGPFDAVWDRGSFGTVAYHLRQPYIDMVRRGLDSSKPFCYLLEAWEYERGLKNTSPLDFTVAEINGYFGDWTSSVELLEKKVTSEKLKVEGYQPELIGKDCWENIFFIKNK